MTPVITPTAVSAISEQYPQMLRGGEPVFVVGFFVAVVAVLVLELVVWRRRR